MERDTSFISHREIIKKHTALCQKIGQQILPKEGDMEKDKKPF